MAQTVTPQLVHSRYVSSDSTMRHARAQHCWQTRRSASIIEGDMRATLKIAIAGVGLLFAGPTRAQVTFQTGNDLMAKCNSAPGYTHGVCLGYVLGTNDTITTMQQTGVAPKLICVPNGATAGQLNDVVIKYLNDNPANRHYTAASSIWVALRAAFPCR